jgi:insulysin
MSDPPLTGVPRSSFPSKSQLEKNRRLVDEYLDCLTVDNGIVTVMSKSFDGLTDQQEKWYGTDYRIREVPPSTLAKWQNCEAPKKLKLDFPKPNPFIPSEEGLAVKIPRPKNGEAKKRTFEEKMQPVPPPKVVRDDGRWTVYFKQDDRFGKPNGFLIFQLLTKEVFANPTNAALANMFELCVTDRLTEYAYDGMCRGIHTFKHGTI